MSGGEEQLEQKRNIHQLSYTQYICGQHGRQLLEPGIRPTCGLCGSPCFTPAEWAYRKAYSEGKYAALIREALNPDV
jgi:hypothetical protein